MLFFAKRHFLVERACDVIFARSLTDLFDGYLRESKPSITELWQAQWTPWQTSCWYALPHYAYEIGWLPGIFSISFIGRELSSRLRLARIERHRMPRTGWKAKRSRRWRNHRDAATAPVLCSESTFASISLLMIRCAAFRLVMRRLYCKE